MKSVVIASIVGLISVAAPAGATTLSITDVAVSAANSHGRLCLPTKGCKLTATSDLSSSSNDFAAQGDTWSFTFADLNITRGLGGDFNGSVSVDFTFDPAANGSVGSSANVSYGTIFGMISGGILHWTSNDLTFTAGTEDYSLHLNDLAGLMFGHTAYATGSIKILTDPTRNNADPISGDVPEPASWALMLGGFGLIGCAMRARRPSQVTFA